MIVVSVMYIARQAEHFDLVQSGYNLHPLDVAYKLLTWLYVQPGGIYS